MQAPIVDTVEIRKQVQKAQEMVIRQEIEIKFKKNIRALNRYCPELYKKYKHYQPTQKTVCIDPLGYPNLADKGIAVYNGNPKLDSQRQVRVFEYKPLRVDLRLARCAEAAVLDRFGHARILEKFIDLEDKYRAKAKVRITADDVIVPEKVNFLTVVGLGLGYHIEELSATHDIRNLFIYEPDDDVFYATLFTIDWEPIFKQYKNPNYSLNMLIGGSIDEFYELLAGFFDRHGIFNVAKMFIYKHLEGNEIDKAFDKLEKYVSNFYEGWGFFEDEVISISHTIHNFTHAPKVYNSQATLKKDYLKLPVVLIANGPSLDDHVDVLRELQDKAIIVCCCASTLSSLSRYGITPDFLAVMERTRGVMDWVDEVSSEDYRKSIRFISINHTHPDVGNSFGQWGIALKTFDTGARFISEFIDDPDGAFLHQSANSGTNTAISFIGDMGFENCYLFGVDMGYKNKGHHHSKQSSYFDPETGKDKDRYEIGTLKRRANFGGTVYTSSIMDTSRRIMEISLQRNNHMRCFNSSDGVYIFGTIPFKPSEMPLMEMIEQKEQVCDEIMETMFPGRLEIGADLVKEKMDHFSFQLNALFTELLSIMEEPVSDGAELVLMFGRQYKLLRAWGTNCDKQWNGREFDLKANNFTVLVGGSLCHLHTQVAHTVLTYEQWYPFDEMWIDLKPLFHEYFRMCSKVIETDCNQLDKLSRFEYE